MRIASAAVLVLGCGLPAAQAADPSSMVGRVAAGAEQAASSGAGASASARAIATEDVRGAGSVGQVVAPDRDSTERAAQGAAGPGRASASGTVSSLAAPVRAMAPPDRSPESRGAG